MNGLLLKAISSWESMNSDQYLYLKMTSTEALKLLLQFHLDCNNRLTGVKYVSVGFPEYLLMYHNPFIRPHPPEGAGCNQPVLHAPHTGQHITRRLSSHVIKN